MQRASNPIGVFSLIPKKEAMLVFFFAFTSRRWDFFQGIGIVTRIVYDGGNGHGRWRKVLHLLQLKSRVFRLTGEIGHIL